MAKKKINFKLIHLLHALFIVINIITGFFMLRGFRLMNIHVISGILILTLPALLLGVTYKSGVFFNLVFVRISDIRKNKVGRLLIKVTASLMFVLAVVSVVTGVLMRFGGVHSVFNIHLFSYKTLASIIPFHLLFVAVSRGK